MTDNSGYYKDKIAIVTGGNSGIGYALCEELLKRGATVYMVGRNPEKVETASKKLSEYGDRIRTIIVDVTVQEQVQKAIEDTAREAGRIDLLFNNAGVGGTIPFEKATLDDWKTIIDTNLWSVIYGIHAAVPIMAKQGFGHIINTSSLAGIIPFPFQSLYSSTKFAVTAITECLKYEYAEKGLYFSTICPSDVATPIFKKSIDGEVDDELNIPEDAYPVDAAVLEILDKVAERKGIIVVPEEPGTSGWKMYATEDPEAERLLLEMANERRKNYEEKGTFF